MWPGDQPFQTEWTARVGEGSPANVGAMHLSTHTGTHVDAPLHVLEGAPSIDALSVDVFVGPAQVISATGESSITQAFVAARLLPGIERILFRTRVRPATPEVLPQSYMWIEPDAMRFMAERGIRLVGIDCPSIDPPDSHTLPAHMIGAAAGIVNIENLDLTHVEDGTYLLVAAPLPLVGLDASPVRALLLCL